MIRKTDKKRPPGIGQPGGKMDAKRGREISYSHNSTESQKITNRPDLMAIAETLDLQSEVYNLLSQAARLTAILRERRYQ